MPDYVLCITYLTIALKYIAVEHCSSNIAHFKYNITLEETIYIVDHLPDCMKRMSLYHLLKNINVHIYYIEFQKCNFIVGNVIG